MAKNKFQLDEKNADGKLSKYEEAIGGAKRSGNFNYDFSGCAR